MTKRVFQQLRCLMLVGFAAAAFGVQAAERPNVLIILADDMGYSDAGCYGGEIRTSNLDQLAAGGLRFTQFYNTARCWPTRAAIMTGYYAQEVRRDTVPGVKSGGGGTRPEWARLLPALLKPLGYRTYHSGKWHIELEPAWQAALTDRSASRITTVSSIRRICWRTIRNCPPFRSTADFT